MSIVGKAARSFKARNTPNGGEIERSDRKVLKAIRSYLNLLEALKKKAQSRNKSNASGKKGFDYEEFKEQMSLVEDSAMVAKHAAIFINKLRYLIEKRKMDEAEILFKTLYINGCPLKFGGYAISIKRKYSEGEWTRFLISKSKFIKFAKSYSAFASKAFEYLGHTNKMISAAGVCHSLYLLGGDLERVRRTNPGASPKQIRQDMKNGYKSMKEVMNLVGNMADFAPVGVKDYIKLTVDVFNKAEVVVKIADHHAELWEEALEYAQKHINKMAGKETQNHVRSNVTEKTYKKSKDRAVWMK